MARPYKVPGVGPDSEWEFALLAACIDLRRGRAVPQVGQIHVHGIYAVARTMIAPAPLCCAQGRQDKARFDSTASRDVL